MLSKLLPGKVALITGAAKRLGAAIAHTLHDAGMNLILHYRSSAQEAYALQRLFNQRRPDSAIVQHCELSNYEQLDTLIHNATQQWQQLDALINNASSFYATPVGQVSPQTWDDIFASNLKAPFFLSQAAAPWLRRQQGMIINMIDIYAQRPHPQHTVYCCAKAGLAMLTQSLARELAPDVRVNGIAPGAILWHQGASDSEQQELLPKVPLARLGKLEDIARAVLFLLAHGDYITGQVINVDGGRTLFI